MSEYFKTGVLVDDLERAMRDLGGWLGLSWTPIQEVPLVLRTATGDEQVDLRFVFSTGSPPYLELLQAQPTGYYAASQGEHIHHVGRWVPDLAVASRELEAAGFPLEAAGVDPDGNTPSLFCFHKGAHGLRIELAGGAGREGFEAWLAGGELDL